MYQRSSAGNVGPGTHGIRCLRYVIMILDIKIISLVGPLGPALSL